MKKKYTMNNLLYIIPIVFIIGFLNLMYSVRCILKILKCVGTLKYVIFNILLKWLAITY